MRPLEKGRFLLNKGEIMKNYIIIAIVIALIAFTYWAGGRIAKEKCHANIAKNNQEFQIQSIKQKEKINAETYSSGVADLRNRLREKYTIAE